jgi:hypothetical protein
MTQVLAAANPSPLSDSHRHVVGNADSTPLARDDDVSDRVPTAMAN